MRRTPLVRHGALLTAAALSLTLTAGPASADDVRIESGSVAADTSTGDRPGSFPAPTASSSSRAGASLVQPASAGDATIKAFSLKSAVMGSLSKYGNGEARPTIVRGTLTFNYFNGAKLGTRPGGAPNAYAPIYVNDVLKPTAVWAYPNRPTESLPGLDVPRAYGVGKFRVSPYVKVYLTPRDNPNSTATWTQVNTKSNVFYIRRDTWGTFKVRHKGKTVSFSARARIRATNGAAVTAKTGYIEYSSKGKWKRLKKLKLNSTGNAKWSYKKKGKRTYRFVVKRTSVVNGMTIKLPKV